MENRKILFVREYDDMIQKAITITDAEAVIIKCAKSCGLYDKGYIPEIHEILDQLYNKIGKYAIIIKKEVDG